MATVPFSGSGDAGAIWLDVCARCYFVWFDPNEYAQILAGAGRAAPKEQLSLQAREAGAMLKLESRRRAQEARPADDQGPDETWKSLPALLGLPVECDEPVKAGKPVLTWGLSAVMVVLFVWLAVTGTLEGAITNWGFIPARWFRHDGATLAAAFFLHGGVLHLVFNLYVFLIFADNVEDHLGKGRFLLLLAGAHLAGMLVHAIFDPRGDVPCVGASAGISGVISYYAIAFPAARLGFLFRFWWYFRWVRIRAIWALVIYVLLQILGSWQQVAGYSHVSSLAHLGGLAIGVCAALWARASRRAMVEEKTPYYGKSSGQT